MSQLPLGLGKSTATGLRADFVVGVVDAALGDEGRLDRIAGLFPHVEFRRLTSDWAVTPQGRIIAVVVKADASALDDLVATLRSAPASLRIIVVLENADVAAMRLLTREGAADILPAPVSDPALAMSLERLLATETPASGLDRKDGEIVAILKAGGGVGATSLAVQTTAMLAAREGSSVCLTDLDLQFGSAAAYLDISGAITLTDILAMGVGIDDVGLISVLARHRSGTHLLAAPKDMMPLEGLKAPQIDGLVSALRRDFALSLVDLPAAWTNWTLRTLTLADRIVLVGQLTVPHIQLMMRQVQFLTSQGLGDKPLVMVCNRVTAEQLAAIPLKVAEKTLGRPYDVVVPEDARTMTLAVNQGADVSSLRAGAKLEKAIGQLADRVANTTTPAKAKRWF